MLTTRDDSSALYARATKTRIRIIVMIVYEKGEREKEPEIYPRMVGRCEKAAQSKTPKRKKKKERGHRPKGGTRPG